MIYTLGNMFTYGVIISVAIITIALLAIIAFTIIGSVFIVCTIYVGVVRAMIKDKVYMYKYGDI